MRVPASAALRKLAEDLNRIQEKFRTEGIESRETDALSMRAIHAVEELNATLPTLLANCRDGLVVVEGFERQVKADYPGSNILKRRPHSRILEQRLETLEALAQAVATATLHPPFLVSADFWPAPLFESWHDIAGFISAVFVTAMASANPDFRVGRSSDGPGARFVAAVLPVIAGQNPSVGTVGQYLKSRETQ